MRLRHVGYIASSTDDGVDQARGHVHTGVRLHAKVPVIALLRLVHFRITLAVFVLRRWRRRDERSVNDVPFTHGQPLACKVSLDLVEDAASQLILFEQAAELQQRRRIGRRIMREVDTHKITNRDDVVIRIFDPFVGQPETLLGDVHAQHALKANGRTTTAIAFRIVRQQQCGNQRWPRCRCLDLRQETLTPRLLLLAGKLDVRKAGLFHRFRTKGKMRNCASSDRYSVASQ